MLPVTIDSYGVSVGRRPASDTAQERRLRFFFFDALCSRAGGGRIGPPRARGARRRRGRRAAPARARGLGLAPAASRGPRAARAAAAGSATARPRRSPTPWACRFGQRPRKSIPRAASQKTRMMPCWSMGRIGATATPTMTPSTPMKRVSSPTRMALSEMIAMREAERQRRGLPDELADEGGRRAERVRRGGVGLVDGVDEVVGAEVARDLGHRAADAEPDGADGGQDERDLRHPRPARAGRAEQVGHGEEDRQRARGRRGWPQGSAPPGAGRPRPRRPRCARRDRLARSPRGPSRRRR